MTRSVPCALCGARFLADEALALWAVAGGTRVVHTRCKRRAKAGAHGGRGKTKPKRLKPA